MTSFTGIPANSPTNYLGPDIAITSVVTRTREPTGADYRQPNNGKLYPFASFWLVGKNPTTGTQGDLWYLSKIVANVAYWLQIGSGGGGGGGFTPNANVQISDDFFASEADGVTGLSPVIVSQLPWLYQDILPTGAIESGHPGILSSVFSGVNYYIFLGQPSDVIRPIGNFVLGGGEITVNWVFKINTLSDNTNRYIMRLGLGDTPSADQANGVYFQYSHNLFSGRWAMKTAAASVVNFSSTSIDVTTGWHNLSVSINANRTLATYVVDGVTTGTMSLTIPTAPITPFIDITYTSGTGVLDAHMVDLMYLNQELTTSR